MCAIKFQSRQYAYKFVILWYLHSSIHITPNPVDNNISKSDCISKHLYIGLYNANILQKNIDIVWKIASIIQVEIGEIVGNHLSMVM